MKSIFALAILGLSAAAPAAGQQVQLMNFGSEGEDIILHVGRPDRAEPTVEATASLEDGLAADFGALAPAPLLEETIDIAPTSQIPVPLWMRTGYATGAVSAASLGTYRPYDGPCSPPAYRPRRDLGFAAEQRRATLYPLISSIACEHGLPVGLFDALIAQESRYQLNALSPVGAMGLAQLMPGTARYLGVANPWDVVQNLRGGARYLREQLDEFGRVDLALAAYNAGPGRVRTRRQVPRIRETMNYVSTITAAWSGSVSREVELIRADTPGLPRNPFRQAAVLTYTSPSTANPM
ncbi:lytic transglycosylase domain-containing protein [Croceicoccus marinus]|uniref:Lytic transglycosylase domain-containing protein n=1 Tax=Croceicoccus marinus TaxID=450378 RepID=A0A7G6W1C1_9SPHN|nr:lytic transglycosylase domain-containing protein [Croceicoccus marinus]QNE07786.1 lytic transglycosylase domain-containing protein [Croceicoccus marinus]